MMATHHANDLRDLICVSRLTYVDSDEELDNGSDEEDSCSRGFNDLSLNNNNNSSTRAKSWQSSSSGGSHCSPSPDSGFATSTSPSGWNAGNSSEQTFALSKKGKKKRKKKKNSPEKNFEQFQTARHELPKSMALPPVGTRFDNPPSDTFSNDAPPRDGSGRQKVNFDAILPFIDPAIVAGWLTHANEAVSELCSFCNGDDNFVQFAHFWLTDFPDIQKHEIYELERGILLEELSMAFTSGRQAGKVTHRDVTNVLTALFKEYPGPLMSSKGNQLFLDYLDILSSNRTSDYKKLLSDVKCSTRNKQYAQCLLAARSFTLVNIWTAVVNFFRNLLGKYPVAGSLPLPSSLTSRLSINHQRIVQAIKLGFVDVIHYMIKSDHIEPHMTDSQGRTLIFTAVMFNKLDVLNYLLNRVKPSIDINHVSGTGNTALHAAANAGNAAIVMALLAHEDINVNCLNRQCDNSTPLHLAIMHGHRTVVESLLKAGADRTAKMGDLTPQGVAREFDRAELVHILDLR